uniref:Uncharacterized protein n=1 Tax=Arundo donax TaxID=35708 RepID=A0A0A9AQP3_ARUDO
MNNPKDHNMGILSTQE